MTGLRFRHAHQSSRWDRTPESLERNARRLAKSHGLVTFTELAEEHRAERLRNDPALVFLRGSGGRNADELAARWSHRVWELRRHATVKLAEHGGGMGDAPVWALLVWLRHRASGETVLVVVVHLPRDVDAGARREALAELGERVKKVRQRNGAHVLVTGDFNLDHRDPGVRIFVRSFLALPSSSWSPPRRPSRGTHGRRLIDASWSDLRVVTARVLDHDASSDHRPFSATYEAR